MASHLSRGLCRLAATCACAVAIAACGNSASGPGPRIRLALSAPPSVHTGSATVSGTVSPSTATVLVLGRPVAVHRGSFSTQVSLDPGTNIIDVLAGAPRAQDAMSAVRVYRLVYVTVPDLTGDSGSDAARQLRALGVVPQVNKDDPFFAVLIPGSDSVCGSVPAAGARVSPGTTVTVTVSKTC